MTLPCKGIKTRVVIDSKNTPATFASWQYAKVYSAALNLQVVGMLPLMWRRGVPQNH